MSREHFISRGLLQVGSLDNMVKIAGLDWQEAQAFDVVGIDALAPRVLCRRHNSALGGLDASVQRLATTVNRFDRELGDGNASSEMVRMPGEDVERWMLKMLLGGVASGNLSGQLRPSHVGLLLGHETWPPGAGLYLGVAAGSEVHHTIDFQAVTLVHPVHRTVEAAKVWLAGLPFSIALGRAMPQEWGVFRPSGIAIHSNGVTKTLELCWPGPAGPVLRFNRTGTYSGTSPDWPDWAREEE